MTLAPDKLETPPGYHPLDDRTLAGYLTRLGDVAVRLGGSPDEWLVREVGDGNLNLVFIVDRAGGGVAVKQALPYVRLVERAGRCRSAAPSSSTRRWSSRRGWHPPAPPDIPSTTSKGPDGDGFRGPTSSCGRAGAGIRYPHFARTSRFHGDDAVPHLRSGAARRRRRNGAWRFSAATPRCARSPRT